MRSKSDSIKFASCNDGNEIGDEFFEQLRLRYQGNLKTSMEGSEFILDLFQMMYLKCHKVNLKRGNSYLDSPDWIKSNNNS